MSLATQYRAFHGQPALKTDMVGRTRAKWAQGQVFPLSYLKWRTDGGMVSLSGALAETQDPVLFVERTGLPVELGTLCEGLVNSGAEFREDKSAPMGLVIAGSQDILRFAMEWLEAIPVGADLGCVVPRFMHGFLSSILEPEFAMAAHVSSSVRACAVRILGLWERELDGTPIAPKEWRTVRADALQTCDEHGDPWGYSIAELVESLAWPVQGLAPEFVPIFQIFGKDLRQFLAVPYLAPEDRGVVTESLVGLRVLNRAQRDPQLSQLPMEKLLERDPQAGRAVVALMKPDMQARLDAARLKAQPQSDYVLRQQMDGLRRLIEASAA